MGRTRAGVICYRLATGGMSVRRRSVLVWGMAGLAVALSAACGSKPAPLSPSLGVSTITNITLSVRVAGVGSTVQQAGMLTLSNGHTVEAPSGYASDTPSVATITPSGAMTGISIGDMTISVDYQGFHASQKVRVLPSYSGIFEGTYTLDRCTDSGGFTDTGFCASFPAGWVGYLAMSNAQSADLTSLTGAFKFDQSTQAPVGTSTGTISSSGDLTYAGALVSGTTRIEFRNFSAASTSAGHITGHFEIVETDSTLTGSGVMTCTIADLARTSGGVVTASLAATLLHGG